MAAMTGSTSADCAVNLRGVSFLCELLLSGMFEKLLLISRSHDCSRRLAVIHVASNLCKFVASVRFCQDRRPGVSQVYSKAGT